MLAVVLSLFIPVLVLWSWHRRRQVSLSADGKAVFITGCDTGIGHETAILLDKLGFTVFAGCLFPEGEGTKTLRSQASAKMVVVPLDVTSQDQVLKASETVQKMCADKQEELCCVINNAGLCVVGELEWHTWKQIERLVNVNIMGYIRVIKAFLPLLKSVRGRIINVTSVNGRWAYPGLSVYSATKFAIEGLSNSLRVELDQYGIKVVMVAPGDYAKLTSIMNAHRTNAQEQWEELSEETQQKYGEYFWAYHETCLKYSGMGSPSSFHSSQLLKDIHNAVTKTHPLTRYISAPLGFRLFVTLVNVLPSQVGDRILQFGWKSIFPMRPPSVDGL